MHSLRDPRAARRWRAQALTGSTRRNPVVDCAVYVDGKREPVDPSPDEGLAAVTSSGQGFVWIGLHEPTDADFRGLTRRFGLHPLTVEDAVHAHQRPKLERYDEMIFVVFKTVRYVPHTEMSATSEVVDTGEIMVFLGHNFVITVRHGEHGSLREMRRRLEAHPERLALGPAAVLHAVADRVVDGYLGVAQRVQDDVDDVENAVFSARRSRDAERIYQLKREVLELRRAVMPLAAPLRELSARPMRLVAPQIREYFRDVDDHLTRVSETIASYDELLTTLVQANLAQVTVAQNEDMRKITAWVAIISVPTAVAGLYGMNFEHMPETKWKLGYPLILGVIALICLMLHRGFRRNGWL